MAIVQSTIHKNLNRDVILKDTWWIYYCCCEGLGLGAVADPLCAGEGRNLCVHSACTTADIIAEDGLCGNMEVFCCITQQFQLPPLQGSPGCILANKQLAGGAASVTYKDGLFDYGSLFKNTFWVYYMFCCGCGVSGIGDSGRPLFGAAQKFFCIRENSKCVTPCEDGIWCSSIATELCLWSQCQFPPAPGAPKVALCNMKFGGGAGNGSAGGEVVLKPTQVAMY